VPSIGHLTRVKPGHVHVDLGDGDTLNIVFNLNGITPAWVQRTQEPDVMSVARALADVIAEWDVTDEQGQPYPPTTENISSLSYPVETAIAMKLIEAAAPVSEEGNVSSGPSSIPPTDSTPLVGTSQNSGATSPSPTVSESPSPT
jgi:hypothetical protein